MTDQEYLTQIAKLLQEANSLDRGQRLPRTFISHEITDIFNDRYAEGLDLAEEEGFYDDSQDYHAMGYALHDDVHEDAEIDGYTLDIHNYCEVNNYAHDQQLEKTREYLQDIITESLAIMSIGYDEYRVLTGKTKL